MTIITHLLAALAFYGFLKNNPKIEKKVDAVFTAVGAWFKALLAKYFPPKNVK
jgi:hypothetical protein